MGQRVVPGLGWMPSLPSPDALNSQAPRPLSRTLGGGTCACLVLVEPALGKGVHAANTLPCARGRYPVSVLAEDERRRAEAKTTVPGIARPGGRRLDVQGLRAVAVILVVAFHAGLPIRGGFIGVDVFLVISGFVITAMLLRELESSGTIRFRTFYTRRIKRLLPALAVVTTVVMALSVFYGSSFGSQQTTARTGLGATFFSANVVIYRDSTEYFSPEAATNPLLNTWTLSVEEQVYLVFPALLLGSWMVGRRLSSARGREGRPRSGRRSWRVSKRSAAVMLGLVGVPSFALSVAVSFGLLPLPPQFAFFSSITRVWEFAVGAALALAAKSIGRWPAVRAMPLGLAGAAAIMLGAFLISGATPYPGVAVILPVFGASAVIASGFDRTAGVGRLLATKPMVAIGDVSYSWYLWHWPLIVFGAIAWPGSTWVTVAIGGAAFIPAWISQRFLENPIRTNDRIKGWRMLVLAAVCTLIPTAAALGLSAGARASWGNDDVATMQVQVSAEHVAATAGCDDASTAGVNDADVGCEFNSTAKGPHVYLEGNSVAAMYSEGLIGATKTLDLPLAIATSNGCFSAVGGNRECTDDFESTVRRLARRKPGIVVISSTWDLGSFGIDPDSEKTPQEKADALVVSLEDAINKLQRSGHHVLIVLPTPRFFYGERPGTFQAVPVRSATRDAHATVWRPRDCSASVAQANTSACGATVPRGEESEAQDMTIEALQLIADETGASTLDLRSEFCWAGVCRTNDGDRWMFEDGLHISVSESQRLAPVFVRSLKDISRDDFGYFPRRW